MRNPIFSVPDCFDVFRTRARPNLERRTSTEFWDGHRGEGRRERAAGASDSQRDKARSTTDHLVVGDADVEALVNVRVPQHAHVGNDHRAQLALEERVRKVKAGDGAGADVCSKGESGKNAKQGRAMAIPTLSLDRFHTPSCSAKTSSFRSVCTTPSVRRMLERMRTSRYSRVVS